MNCGVVPSPAPNIPISEECTKETSTFVKTFSTDLSLRGTADVKKLTKEIETTAGLIKKEWFNPPNNPIGAEFSHVGQEVVEPSTRKVIYKGVIARNVDVKNSDYPAGFNYNSLSAANYVISTIKSLIPLMKADALRVYSEY